MRNIKILFFAILLSNISFAKDITTKIEYLGTPYAKQYKKAEDVYSRNSWDLQVYDKKLFIGAGNSANEGPSKNSGPINLIVYDLEKEKFYSEGKIDDDQVDIFKILNNKLLIPGHDAKGSWDWGNFYIRKDDKSWKKFRNIPKALHVYDLVLKDNKLFAGLGLYEGAAVGITTNLGKTWEIQKIGRSRVYSFMNLDDQLFALKKFKRTSKPYFSVAQYINGKFIPRYDISIYDMFPDTKFKIKYSRATRIISFDTRAIYIGAYKYNSHQTIPFGIYIATLKDKKIISKKINLDKGFIANDILKRENDIYILASKTTKKGVKNRVYHTTTKEIDKLKTLFTFDYDTFARSFELYKNDFYFGMGTDVSEGEDWSFKEISSKTGDILKIDASEWLK